MLLFPFREQVEWVASADLRAGDIYYGTRPERASEGVHLIGVHQNTLEFFSSDNDRPSAFDFVTVGGDDVPALFPCAAGGAFDLVASAFYFLSGWQEVFTLARDVHGRARYSDSFQAEHDMAGVPIVDIYRRLFEHQLGRVGRPLRKKKFSGRDWAFCPTHDIDYEKKWRPGIIRREILHRGVLNYEKEGGGRRVRRVTNTIKSILTGKDPFRDAMRRIQLEIMKYDGTGTYFFKSAARDPHDVRFSAGGSFLRKLYQQLKLADFEIGLHPSYQAYNHPDYLKEEQNVLAGSSGVQTSVIRSHYLRFDPRGSPAVLENARFKIDSTLGWAMQEGFRRGTCCPFFLFDISANRETTVVEMPLITMESTLFNRRMYSLDEAIEATNALMKLCRSHGGVFVGLWHNILWDEEDFPGWGEHFTSTLEQADARRGLITSLGNALASWS
jgi:Family of unknown function (DUF7033)